MADVFRYGSSRYWQARIKSWNGKAWVWTNRSTRCEDEDAARAVAAEMQKTADLAGPGKTLSRSEAFKMVESILRASGAISESWDDFAKDWLEVRSQRVKLATQRTYNTHVNNFRKWLTEEGRDDIQVGEIDMEMAQEYYNSLHSSGMSPRSAANNLKTLEAIAKRALSKGISDRNPFSGVERAYGDRNVREPFTLSDVQKLLKTAENGKRSEKRAKEWKTMILLGLCTGARAGDCKKMSWDHYKEIGGSPYLQFSPEKKEGKNQVRRREITIPVLPLLDEHLSSISNKTGPFCPELSALPVGGRYGISDQFRNLVDQSGIPFTTREGEGRGIEFRSKTFHSFRHTLNSIMFNQGVPDEWRMRILDHESKAVNQGYSHADLETMQKYARGLKISL